ncbi:gliding motility lipoprotein GldB [Mucilaginibacter ginkgonis]|uniref:Gliding motility lipoprotein GldB n=1 Tax=Mucilaginibacter ginkgonis TaxID=2682091 RepID=A0A6I4IML8_9SPHI|nr:gliding motility lipoprotein GldB [Mucilaginibacter ginkgonis]QQL50086.1 gliding motility lipoprotein GldB [Mucilaginibacter ginkgonis]
MASTVLKGNQIYIFFTCLILLAACTGNNKVDVSNIPLTVSIERFDHDLNNLKQPPAEPKAQAMKQKYGLFYQDFIERILHAGSINSPAYLSKLNAILSTQAYIDLKHDVDSIYPNLDKQNAELTDAFKRIKYYFPQKQLPRVYAYLSGFEAQTAIGNGYVGIGLDLFLGNKSRFYPAIVEAYPMYLQHFFTPENITPRVVEGILREDMFPEPNSDKTMLQKMIYNGKIMYAMDLLLPDVGDTTKIRYTTQKMQWAEKFKADIWGYFLEENILYSSDVLKNQVYFDDGPFTAGLGERNESAPKLGTWTGWQIVREYMKRNPNITLKQLMAVDDAQKILNQSHYRPK